MNILGYWPSQMQMYLQDRSHLVELCSSIRDQVVMTDFLLAQKFRLFGVKMESGMMRPSRLLLRMDTMSALMGGWGNKEEVDPGNVRPIREGEINPLLEVEREAEATRRAIKRKIAQAAVSDLQARNLPAKLCIDPNDPEDVKAAKRKKIHAFKSKVRFEQHEVVQNKRQNAWQQFRTTKGKTRKEEGKICSTEGLQWLKKEIQDS